MAIILELALYLIQLGIMVLLFSFKLAWKLIKYEFYWIRMGFKRYPFAFFSFFLHFIGYWLALGLAEAENITWLLKFYTFGLVSNGQDALTLSIWPLTFPFDWMTKMPSDSGFFAFVGIVFMLALFVVWVPFLILAFESLLFLIPLIHAILTQLILGLIFRPYLLKWRQWRTNKFFEKVHKRSQADPEVRAIGDLSRSIRAMWDAKDDAETARQRAVAAQSGANAGFTVGTSTNTGSGAVYPSSSGHFSMEQELRQMGLEPKERLRADGTGTGIMEVELPNYGPAKKAIRDFNESYNRAYEKVTDMSMYCYQAIDFLREQYGENSKAERMYSDMLEKHYDLVDCFKETFDLVCYSENETGIPKAYEEFKRNILMVKNAQEEFVKTLEELYGKTLIQAIFKKLKEE